MNYRIIKAYKDDSTLRFCFNELARKTFGLNFEDWYQNGYWGENYVPYSIFDGQKIAANVSVNITDFLWNGETKHFIQLGTVMTEEKYRNKGLIRRLMQEIEMDYGKKADGFYLFANDSVLDFYPKFGFQKAAEYQYSKQVSIHEEKKVKQVPMKEKKDWKQFEHIIEKSVNNSKFGMIKNVNLIMFYITKFMWENVFYIEEQNTYVIAETEGENLLIHNVFSETPADLDRVIRAFGEEIKHVTLGFVPQDTEHYIISKIQEEDTTLFVKGKGFNEFEQDKIMFPTLSHA